MFLLTSIISSIVNTLISITETMYKDSLKSYPVWNHDLDCPGGWGLLSRFSPCRYSVIFQYDQTTSYLYKVTFMFDMCHRSWAAETPDKYERDWKYLTYTFAKSKFPVTEKLSNGVLATPAQQTRGCCMTLNNYVRSIDAY